MRYLVTGGAGFIGSHLVDYLLKAGNDVVCLDNFDNFYSEEIKNKNITNAFTYKKFKLVRIDLNDVESLDTLFRQNDFDTIFHLASKAGVRPSILNPKDYYENNVLGTLNILEMVKKYSTTKKIVFTSSSSVYGNNNKVPFDENDNVDNPISPYAATKKAAELLCYNYHYLHDISIYCLRLFTVFGPRQRPDLAIHKFTNLMLNNEEIPVYGDGTMKRDYTYVSDIINGIVTAAERLNGFEIINLGNASPVSIIQLVKTLGEILGIEPNIKYLPQPAGDVDITFADVSKAQRLLDYKPTYPLHEGLIEFIKWKKS